MTPAHETTASSSQASSSQVMSTPQSMTPPATPGRKALITGISGQDGSYLAELLLQQGYEVHGLVRRVAMEDGTQRLSRLQGFLTRVQLHTGSLENYGRIYQLMAQIQPDEVYHLAAQSYVASSFEDPFSTLQINIQGTHHVLEAVRQVVPQCRVYFAASSEMFGNADHAPQSEQTPLRPRSPYGISKVTGFELARNYREAHGMFVAAGILFNHESPRRGFEFVTRKISWHVARIRRGLATELALGNLAARRDWGFAGDYVRAMHLMLQHSTPDDFVIATGQQHSVQEFCERAFARVGLDWQQYVVSRTDLLRPAEVHLLLGDASKARQALGWQPQYSFEQLVDMMVDADCALVDGSRPVTDNL